MNDVSPPPKFSVRSTLSRAAVLPCAFLLAAISAVAQPVSPYYTAVTALNPADYWPLQETTPTPTTFVESNYSTYVGGPGALATMYYSSYPTTFPSTGNLSQYITFPCATGPSMLFAGNTSAMGIVPTTTNAVSLAPGQPFSVEFLCMPFTTANYQGIIDQEGPVGTGGNNASSARAGWCFNQNYVPMIDDGSGNQSGALYGFSFAVFNGTSPYQGAQAVAPYQYLTNTIVNGNPVFYHLVGVFDGTNCSVYINGVLASSPATSVAMPAGTSFVPDTWDPLQIGCSRGIAQNAWHGALCDVAIYNFALTSSQVATDYADSQQPVSAGNSSYENQVFANDPFMFWYMNTWAFTPPGPYAPASPSSFPVANNYGSQAATITNLDAPHGNNSYYEPGTVPGMPGPSYAGFGTSYAVAFNGINGAVDAGYTNTLDPLAGTNYSIVGWFKDNPSDNNGRTNSLVSHGANSWRFDVYNGATKFNPGLADSSDVTGPSMNVNDGNWHMFACTLTNVKGTTNIATIYIDATVSNSATLTGAISGNTSTNVFLGGAPDFAQVNFSNYVNYNSNYNGSQQYYAGELAHVAFFTNVLSFLQIQSLYNASEAPPLIISQPASVAGVVNGGGTDSFSVTASGAATLTYQWYLTNSGGVSAVGTSTNVLTLAGTTSSESGSYFVVVSNSYGAITSSFANLQIATAPVITSQVGSGTLDMYLGQYYTVSVTASGAPTLTYQWYTNGMPDTTAGLASSYAITNVQLTQSGESYYCVVSNTSGTATNLTTTIIVSSLPASLTSSPYSSALLALNPSAYWPMHEVSPGVTGDVETNLGSIGAAANGYYADWDINYSFPTNYIEILHGRTGAIVNDPDTCVDFIRGPASYMIVPHTSPQATVKAPFSVEVWCYPVNNANYEILAGQGGGQGLNGSANLGGWDLEWSGPGVTNSFELTLFSGVGSTSATLSTYPNYPPGQWYDVVATYDGTNLNLYINGALPTNGYAPGSVSNGFTMYADYWTPLSVATGRITDGASSYGAPDEFTGLIDEVSVYSNVLSTNRIATHYTDAINGSANYKSDVSADNPLLYYRMDSPPYTPPARSTWTVVTNYGTNYGNGVYWPGATPGSYSNVTPAGFSAAVSSPISGMGTMAEVDMFPGDNPVNFTSFSYSAFFRTYPADSRESGWQSIMSANDADWRASINIGAGNIVGHGDDQDETGSFGNDGNWHHIVVVSQASAAAGRCTNWLYIDGVLSVSNSVAGTNSLVDPGPVGYIGNEYGFSITNSFSANPCMERCLSGTVCEAAFFMNQVLTPTQVSNLYHAAEVPPFFVTQPISTNMNGGVNFTNSVTVGQGSTNNLTIQWYTNGMPLLNQTNATLPFTPVSVANVSTDYYCVISTSYGTVTSSVAYLNVLTTPVITNAAPVSPNITALAGATIGFSVGVEGSAPMSYFWYSNNLLLSAVTNNNFTNTVSNILGTGTYSVVVSNAYGEATDSWNVTTIAPSGTFQAATIALNPVGYWPLNETSGTTAYDLSGNGNNGTYENAILEEPGYDWFETNFNPNLYDTNTSAGFGISVEANSCVYGISNIDFSTPTNTSGQFTVQCWVFGLSNNINGLNAPGIVSKGYWANEEFTIDTSGSKYRFTIRNAGNTEINAASSVAANDNKWHLLVGVCDQIHSVFTLFIDGTNAAQGATSPTQGITSSDSSPTLPIPIGARSSANTFALNNFDQQYVGYVADVALYKYALTTPEVTNLYYATGFLPSFTKNTPAVTNVANTTTLTLSPKVTGTAPFTYQWYDTNGLLATQTNLSLVVPDELTNDSYYLVVSNAWGEATSVTTAVTVDYVPVVISVSPSSNVLTLAGAILDLSVNVVGTDVGYLWYSNSTLLADPSNSLPTPIATNATFTMWATNSAGSNSATITVTVDPTSGGFVPKVLSLGPIGFWPLNEPLGSTVCIDYINGNDGTYESNVLGILPNYDTADSAVTNFYDTNTAAQFGYNGTAGTTNSCAYGISNIDFSCPTNVSGEFTVQAWVQCPAPMSSSTNTPGIVGKGLYNNEEFVLDAGGHSSTGFSEYRFAIRNAGAANIGPVAPFVAGSDTNWHFLVGVCDGASSNVTLYVDGTNAGTAVYLPGSGIDSTDAPVPVTIGSRTSQTVVYSPALMNEQFAGNIAAVAIFNYALSSNQVVAEYAAAGVQPTILPLSVTNLTTNAGSTVAIPAVVIGSPTLSLQWYDTNGAVSGQTNAALTISNDFVASDTYYLVATNIYGVSTSLSVAITTVSVPTVVVDLQSNITVLADSPFALSVSLVGQQPITNGWQYNGNAVANTSRISGANSNVLTINPIQVSDSGTYQLFATNAAGTTNSIACSVTVVPNLTFNTNGSGWQTTEVSNSIVWEPSNLVDVLQLTSDLGNEDSTAFYSYPVYIGNFVASFIYQVPTGTSGSADGTTFCIQNDPRGTAARGAGGGNLGVAVTTPIVPSVEFELNIYAANGVGGVGVCFDTNGTIGPTNLSTAPVVINNSDPIQVVISYENGLLSATLTDTVNSNQFSTSTNFNIPAVVSNYTAYVGFTGSDGGSKSTQQVSDFSFINYVALTAVQSGGNVILTWPQGTGGYMVEQSPVLGAGASWTPVSQQPIVTNGYNQITIPNPAVPEFYELILSGGTIPQ